MVPTYVTVGRPVLAALKFSVNFRRSASRLRPSSSHAGTLGGPMTAAVDRLTPPSGQVRIRLRMTEDWRSSQP